MLHKHTFCCSPPRSPNKPCDFGAETPGRKGGSQLEGWRPVLWEPGLGASHPAIKSEPSGRVLRSEAAFPRKHWQPATALGLLKASKIRRGSETCDGWVLQWCGGGRLECAQPRLCCPKNRGMGGTGHVPAAPRGWRWAPAGPAWLPGRFILRQISLLPGSTAASPPRVIHR